MQAKKYGQCVEKDVAIYSLTVREYLIPATGLKGQKHNKRS